MDLELRISDLWSQVTHQGQFVTRIMAPFAGLQELTIWHRTTDPQKKIYNIHDYHCFYICLHGHGKLDINGIPFHLKENEAIGVLPAQPHLRLQSENEGTSYLLLRFKYQHPELIEPHFNRVLMLPEATHAILQKIIDCYEEAYMNDTDSFICNKCGMYVAEFFNYICNSREMSTSLSYKADSRLDEAIRLLTSPENIDLSVNVIAKKLGVTPGHLSDMFRDKVGRTPNNLRSGCRNAKAEHCLIYTDLTISQIAELTGFKSIYSFSRFFTKHHNMLSPSEYRKKNRIK